MGRVTRDKGGHKESKEDTNEREMGLLLEKYYRK